MRQPFFEVGDRLEVEDHLYEIKGIRNDTLRTVYYLSGVHFCKRIFLDEATYLESLL